MRILGIETTCDETGVAIVEDGRKIIANVVASSVEIHEKYGGIVPEVAAREQIRSIIPALRETLLKTIEVGDVKWEAGKRSGKLDKIDAIAVANGPGLVGSLLIGVETAKALALAWNKPLVPVNHLIGHAYANWLLPETRNQKLETRTPQFPLVALIVSGGHTDLILMNDHNQIKWLGGTLDDAAGEAFDKVARVLGLGYPGGPEIERVASKTVNLKHETRNFKLPRPLIGSENFDFSFSGLKTAVVNLVHGSPFDFAQGRQLTVHFRDEIAYEFQKAIVDVLVTKTIRAAQKFKAREILLGGGVAANKLLRSQLTVHGSQLGIPVRFPAIEFCIDNGAMIASAAYFNFKPKPPENIQADPGLYF